MRPGHLVTIGGMWAAAGLAAPAPRSIAGDSRQEPPWEEKLTLSVGPLAADIVGSDEKAIQAGVDAVTRHGGGTVRVLAGYYRLRNSVFLTSNVRLIGEGPRTVLIKEASVSSPLAEDSDWYDREITLAHPEGFRLGDGICLRAASARYAVKRTLIARAGARFKLDRPIRDNLWVADDAKATATAATLFPIVSGENIHDAVVENLAFDGNRPANDLLDGNYAGCVWLQDCERVTLRGLAAKNYHGDGLSWQVCHDILVENCESSGHSGLGLHPGSGSQRTTIRNCRLTGNDIGLFLCWGVRGALVERNFIADNLTGISIGHRDTDNLIRDNDIAANRSTGIFFRPDKPAVAGHRNVIENNRLTDNGAAGGAAIDIVSAASDVILRKNQIVETRASPRPVALRLGAGVPRPREEGNEVRGFADEP